MKRLIIILVVLLHNLYGYSQEDFVFQSGEKFHFAMSYGFIKAGKVTLDLKRTTYKDKDVFFAAGHGYSIGMTKMLFKVEDHYQSFFDARTITPYKSIRNIHEGGYERNQVTFFDKENNTAKLKDLGRNTEKTFDVPDNVQDVISAFYYLRNHPKINAIKEGEIIELSMFFDDEIFTFQLKFLGREKLKTKFGKLDTLVFRPYVQKGRVFKESESLTMWISDDKNKIPLKVKADLLVGSVKAELEYVEGIKFTMGTK
ncbi:MAG: DUF3108 domain-containing protein [Flavobacteriales bacterium]|nr:DUF3108 domain-containing protein [Flavobacteriales bacterium]